MPNIEIQRSASVREHFLECDTSFTEIPEINTKNAVLHKVSLDDPYAYLKKAGFSESSAKMIARDIKELDKKRRAYIAKPSNKENAEKMAKMTYHPMAYIKEEDLPPILSWQHRHLELEIRALSLRLPPPSIDFPLVAALVEKLPEYSLHAVDRTKYNRINYDFFITEQNKLHFLIALM